MGAYASADTAAETFAYKVTNRSYSAISYIIIHVERLWCVRVGEWRCYLRRRRKYRIEFYLKIFRGLFKTSKSIIPFRSFLASSTLLTSEHGNTETEQIELPPRWRTFLLQLPTARQTFWHFGWVSPHHFKGEKIRTTKWCRNGGGGGAVRGITFTNH